MSMIYVKNTPNNTGVAVYGDHRDFEGLYEALHDIVGNEDEFLIMKWYGFGCWQYVMIYVML